MSDLRQVFNELVRFEIELWNAVDARLKTEFDLPLTHRLRTAGRRAEMERTA
jgi:MarR family transcriptional regulator, organic hydroperoxide resistance regulator